jgi:hypothetical protein
VTPEQFELTRQRLAAERLRREQKQRAYQILRGEVRVPERCGFCRSTSITPGIAPEAEMAVCASCGKRTPLTMVHRLRQQEIRAVIEKGVA